MHAHASEEDVMIARLSERLIGRTTAAPVADPATGEIIIDSNQTLNESTSAQIESAGVSELFLRSPLTCEAVRGICRACYGHSPATGQHALIGDAVGIIAAQSIGEPGTQLTMRTFHTGGVAGKDITSGLPRVEELFEARSPKGKSRLAEIDGTCLIFEAGQLRGTFDVPKEAPHIGTPPASTAPIVRVVNMIPFTDNYEVPDTHKLSVKANQHIQAGQAIATPTAAASKARSKEEDLPELLPLLA